MTKDRQVYLAHILECIQKIERFTADGKPRFLQDDMVQDALVRNLEINEKEFRTLAAIRNILLPKLISGELRVPEPERMAEEALLDPAAL